MKFLLTNAGKEMESKLVAGGKPIITRIESGDTYSVNPESLQSVINKKQLLQVESIDVVDGKTCITFLLTNLELSEDYWIRQIGIYAKHNEAADEILYLIGQDATGELIPAPEHRIVEYVYKLNLAIDNAYDMQFVVNTTDFVRKKQFEEIVNRWNHDVVVSLPKTGWSGTAPYTQTVAVPGMKATDRVGIHLYAPKNLIPSEVELRQKLTPMITYGESTDGKMTFYCGAKKPTADFQVCLTGVSGQGGGV